MCGQCAGELRSKEETEMNRGKGRSRKTESRDEKMQGRCKEDNSDRCEFYVYVTRALESSIFRRRLGKT
jgi:hypothetical protein